MISARPTPLTLTWASGRVLMSIPALEFGVDVQHIPHLDTALHSMTPAMVVANMGIGNRFAGCSLQM